jgi:DNA-binding MarR family transcriptional regulator
MDPKKMEPGQSAFLLAQIGAHAATQFAQRLSELQLAPSDAGILRILRKAPGISQQDLSARLQVHPSRLVSLLDKLGTKTSWNESRMQRIGGSIPCT